MHFDNRTADRQAHAHSILLRSEEGFEDLVRVREPDAAIAYLDEYGFRAVPFRADMDFLGTIDDRIWFYEHRVPEGQKAYSMTKPIRIEQLKGCVDWWGGNDRKGRAETEVAWKVTIGS